MLDMPRPRFSAILADFPVVEANCFFYFRPHKPHHPLASSRHVIVAIAGAVRQARKKRNFAKNSLPERSKPVYKSLKIGIGIFPPQNAGCSVPAAQARVVPQAGDRLKPSTNHASSPRMPPARLTQARGLKPRRRADIIPIRSSSFLTAKNVPAWLQNSNA